MINIQNTQTIYYDHDKSQVTVYGDFDDPNKWYIVPAVRFAKAAGSELPEFSLVEFKTNEGTEGICSFTTELAVTPEAIQAVKDALGSGITLAQFDWVSAQAFLNFQVGGEDYVINAVPSRYAENRAAFVVHLPTQEWVETWKTAFGPGQGSLSPFRVDYSMLALSKLPAVTVKVKYDSQIAFEYEKTVDINRNVWGKETSRRETIKEQLKQSDAGDTDINWNVSKPSEEMQQRVLDWAWVTLEGLVEKAVDDAIRFVGEKNADQIKMSSTQSFERTYTENQVIEWSILPFVQLPSFTADEWAQVYKKGDTRSLAVSFTLRDSMSAAKIKSVQVNVKYPTKQSSFLFTPTAPTSWTFAADGSAPFSPAYEYQYVVTYDEAGKLYESPWIPSENSMVVLPLAALGIQTAVFIGSNIDFSEAVDFVLIDFFFNLPNGENKHEQKRMVDNTTPIPIPSRSYLPSTNEYTYQLTYVMKDKGVVQVGPRKVFPPQNSDLITIFSPFQETSFYLGVINPPAGTEPRIKKVQVSAVYTDYQNNNSDKHQWNFDVPPADEYALAPAWTINDIVQNPAGASIEYNGVLVMSDSKLRPISKIRDQIGFMNFSYLEMPFSAEFDPFQVDWTKVAKVQVDLFTLEGSPTDQAEIAALVETRTNIASLEFMKPEQGAAPKQYYTFLYPTGTSPVYYYQATYFHFTGPDTYVPETQTQGKTIVLPKDPTSTKAVVLRVVGEAEAAETMPVEAVA